MGLGGVAIAALPSMIHPKLSFSDSLGGKQKEKGVCMRKLPFSILFMISLRISCSGAKPKRLTIVSV